MVGWLVSISNSNLLCYIQICGFSVYTKRKTWIHRRANTVCTPCAFNVCPMCQQCAQVTLTSKHSLGKYVLPINKNWNIAFPFFRFFVSSLWSPRLHRLILLEGRKSLKLKCPLPATNLEACLFYHQKLARSEIELSGYGSLALAAAGAPVAVPVPRRRQPSWLPLGCRQGLLPYTGA
jgi:hypothetical protein